MQNLKFHTLLFIVSLFGLPASAQQQFQYYHYGAPGTLYLYNRLTGTLPVDSVKVAGPNVIWDLSTYNELNTHTSSIVTPVQGIDQFTFLTICSLSGNSSAECFSIWSNTDQALQLHDSLSLLSFSLTDLERYQDRTTTHLLERFLGFKTDVGGTGTEAVVVYQSPDTILNFPVTYNQNWLSRIEWGINLAPIGQNFNYNSHQTRSGRVDAWGTLITPFDTFTNVLRVRTEIHHQDVLNTDTLTLPIDITELEYTWYDTNYKMPVMIARGLNTDTIETIRRIEYLYDSTCPPHAWTVDTDQDVYYLDENGHVTVNFIISGPLANEYTWDYGDGTFEVSTGDTSHIYSEPGQYAIGIQGCMTNCLPLNNCTFGIVEFEILDTTTSVQFTPANQLGIKLFPNPAKETINMVIPVELGKQQYRIVDMTGRSLLEGKLNAGNTSINGRTLPDGMYMIQLWSAEALAQRPAFVRFIMMKE